MSGFSLRNSLPLPNAFLVSEAFCPFTLFPGPLVKTHCGRRTILCSSKESEGKAFCFIDYCEAPVPWMRLVWLEKVHFARK